MRELPATLTSHCPGAVPSGRAGSAPSCAPRRQRIPRAAAAATRCQWQLSRAAAGAAAAPLVAPPPPDYDWRGDIMPETREIIAAQYPQLQDLVSEGVLIVHRRPADYVERRADGYREPGLVFIVGTAHVSAKSADDVARVIDAVTPDAVVVELCRSRSALLVAPGGEAAGGQQQQQEQRQQQQQEEQPAAVAGREAAADGSYEEQQAAAAAAAAARAASGAAASTSPSSGANPLGLSGAGSFGEAMVRTLAQGGQSGLVLRLLLAGQAKRAAARLGVTAGAEFAAAAAAAEQAGAQLVLGDRPVEISLQRAWGALSWRRRAALLRELVAASLAPLPEQLSAEFIESLKTDGAVSSMFAQLSQRYPELVSPLVSERDLYLAWSLKRSKAVNGAATVVGVLGKGHMRGVVHALRHDAGGLRFADLVGGANRKAARRAAAARRLAVELAIGGGAYAAWLQLTGGWP